MERATAEIHEEFDGLLKDRKRKFAYLRAVEEAFGDDRGAPVTIVEMGCANPDQTRAIDVAAVKINRLMDDKRAEIDKWQSNVDRLRAELNGLGDAMTIISVIQKEGAKA
jgi:hypothetical protein